MEAFSTQQEQCSLQDRTLEILPGSTQNEKEID